MNETLRILAHNVNGLLRHRNDVELLVRTENLDIMLISETHLRPEQNFSMRDYNFYRVDQPTENGWGGVGLLIRTSMNHYFSYQRVTDSIQAVGVTVNTPNGEIQVLSIYCPPGHTIKSEEFVSFFNELNTRFLIGGDVNAKHALWGAIKATPRGTQLAQAGRECSCDFLSDGNPTHFPTDPTRKPGIIDIWITKNFSRNVLEVGSLPDYVDHAPILLTLFSVTYKRLEAFNLTNSKTDWERFRHRLQSNTDNRVVISDIETLEKEIKKLTLDIREAASTSTPPRIITHKEFRIPKEILDLVSERRRLRKIWKRTRDPEDKINFNRVNSELNETLKKNQGKKNRKILERTHPY